MSIIDALPVEDDLGVLLTPWPSGPMPADVARTSDGRLHLRVTPKARATFRTVGAVQLLDARSGRTFLVTRAACGAGCRCAAEARWIP